MPWNKEFECMPVEKLQKFQLEKFKETVEWVAKKVPFYKNRFKEMGIKPGDIKSLEDAAKLPVTIKEDLRDNYPFGLCAVPMEEVVRPLSHCLRRACFTLPSGGSDALAAGEGPF